MNRVYYLLLLLTLVACGKKQAISYNEYHKSHQEAREKHIQLIKRDAEMLDTMFSQSIDYVSGKKKLASSSKEELLMIVWENTSEYLKEADDRHQMYVHQAIYNDQTIEPVQKMWCASSDLSLLEAIEPFNIEMDIREYKRDTAVIQIVELKKSVAKAFAMMLEGAEEYHKIVFEQKKYL